MCDIDHRATKIDPDGVTVICFGCEAKGKPQRFSDGLWLPKDWAYRATDYGTKLKPLCGTCRDKAWKGEIDGFTP